VGAKNKGPAKEGKPRAKGSGKKADRASARRPAKHDSDGKSRSSASPRLRRRRLMVVVAAVFAAAVLGTSFPASGLLAQHRQLTAANAAAHRLKSENKALAQEQQQLNSKAEIHRLARQSYQLVDPGQTAYNVLPPGGQSTGKGGSGVTGDPGKQPLVAPANAAGMSPDPGLPTTSSTSPTTSSTNASSTSSSSSSSPAASTPSPAASSTPSSTTASGASTGTTQGTQPTGTSGGFWSRTLRSLEFWR
jgi:cell division protein FtsB